MRIKSDAPLQVTAIVTSSKPPTPEVAIIAKASFRWVADGDVTPIAALPDGLPLSGDLFADDDDDHTGACLYASDLAERKLSAEVMLVGHAFAPRGAPVTELPIMISVGAWKKLLRVIGPRAWTDGVVRAFTAPLPFTKMPLDWSQAFGGPGSVDNPAGKGIEGHELPNLELAGDILRSRSDRPKPAGLGPINPAWSTRASKVGKDYGAKWAKTRKPFRSVDFDWRYFNAAPPDQWIEGFLAGDEEITLQNLNETAPITKSRLPDLRLRAFVKDDTGAIREAEMQLDTLVVDTDREIVALTWRGHLPVRETDLADVKTVCVFVERRADAPVAATEYEQRLSAFEKDPAGLREAVPPEYHAAFFKDEPPAGPVDDDPIVALLDKKLPGALGKDRTRLKEAAQAAAKDDRVRERVNEQVRELEEKEGDEPPVPPAGKPGTFPEMHLRRKMRDVIAQATKARAALGDQELSLQARERLAELDRLPHDPKWKVFDPDYTPPLEPLSTDEPGPGRDLSEQDLTGRDLSGMDLSGANLTQAILTRANLRGAKLQGANLRGAVLFRADLGGADCSGANFTRANACRAIFDGAKLVGANLDQAFFDGASMKAANLSTSKGEYAMFMKAALAGATLDGAALPHADFTASNLDGASLRGARLRHSAFADVQAKRADFDDADLSDAGLSRADLSGATLWGARANRTQARHAIFDEADLSFSVFVGADLTETSAKNAIFFGANLREARLYRATLDDARFERANLFATDLCKARVDRVSFEGASLYDARLLGTSGKDTNFTDAILHRSTLVRG